MKQNPSLYPVGQHPGAAWRVFYTRSRAEKRCHTLLSEAGISSFLPTYVSYRKWSDRKKRVVAPLFTNYIFAHVNEADRLRVLQTPGIVYCVKQGPRFAQLSDEDMRQVQITQNDQESISQWAYSVPEVGETVTILDGPMKGLSGEVLQQRGASYVVVRLKAIRQAIRVLVSSEWIKREVASSTFQKPK